MAGQGRKPKADAIRRAHQQKAIDALTLPASSIAMPEVVAANDAMRECWEWTVEGNAYLRPAHIPQIVTLCWWWSVERQCIENLSAPNGGITTKVDTPMGEKQDADIRTLAMASNQIRQLQSELGVSPLAQQRMGLMAATTAATLASDLPDRVFKMLDAHDGD